MDRMADYDVEEMLDICDNLTKQRKLSALPCWVGDKLYRLNVKNMNSEIEVYDIAYILFCGDGRILFEYDCFDGVICELENIITKKPYLGFYRVFLNLQEAEKEKALGKIWHGQ